jgi:4-hydroxybenzoate polyprenyltransferase
MQGILVPLGFFAMITAIAVVSARYRNQERMELIKHGLASFPAVPGRGALLWGLVLTLAGLGFGLGTIWLGIHPQLLIASLITVPVGIALLLYHRYTGPDRDKAEQLYQTMRMEQSILRADTSAPSSGPAKPTE